MAEPNQGQTTTTNNPPATSEPTGTTTTNQPAVQQTVSSAPSQPAPQPATQPPVQQPQTPQAGHQTEVSMDTVVRLNDEQGNPRFATVKQLVDASQRALSPDELEAFQTYKGIMSGDKAAIARALGMNETEEEPPDPASQVGALQQQVQELTARLSRIEPMNQQLATLREKAEIHGIVEKLGEKLPHLKHAVSQDPTALDEVMTYMNQAREAIRFQGGDPDRVNPAEIRVRVLAMAENRLQKLAALYGGWKPPTTTTNQAAQVTLTDDQQAARQAELSEPPQIRLVNGRMIDQHGREMVQTSGGRFVPIAVDNHIPGTQTAGSMAGTTTNNNGPMNKDQLREQLVLRRQQMSAMGQV